MHPKEKLFSTILAENHQRLFRICCYYIKNTDDRKDLYQEILFNIWKSLDDFRGAAAIGTFIYRIALNTAIGFSVKEFKRKSRFYGTDLQNNHMDIRFDDDEYQKKLEESVEELHRKLNQLSVIDRLIMTLMLEELPVRDIAGIIGITEPNVRIKIHRIKNQLKLEMKGINYEN